MHPSFTEQMSTMRMEQFQREAKVMQRVNRAKNNHDYKTGSSSLTRILWYLLFGLHIPTSNQKQGEGHTIRGFQERLNATMWMVGLIALGVGLLIGGFLYSSFGLVPIVLLTSFILVVVSFPILMRSATLISKHNQIHSHR